jgi:hypothetical protein
MRLTTVASAAALLFVFAASCGGPPPRDIAELSVVDSLYVDAGGSPFTGRVFRSFPDSVRQVQLEGSLRDGLWEGELVVYHANGRVRYMGSFVAGERCGPWTENADSVVVESVYDQLVREVESMGLYPPCEGLK